MYRCIYSESEASKAAFAVVAVKSFVQQFHPDWVLCGADTSQEETMGADLVYCKDDQEQHLEVELRHNWEAGSPFTFSTLHCHLVSSPRTWFFSVRSDATALFAHPMHYLLRRGLDGAPVTESLLRNRRNDKEESFMVAEYGNKYTYAYLCTYGCWNAVDVKTLWIPSSLR